MKKIVVFIVIITFLGVLFFLKNNSHSEEVTTLKFSSWGSQSEIKVLKEIISEFEQENKDIKVDFIHIPQNYFQKIHLLFASNTEPDVIFINNHYINLYAKAGLLENLENYDIDFNNYFDEAINCFKIDNKIFAVPRDISNLVIYYNIDIFKRLDIKETKLKDIKHLREVAKKLTTKEHFGINYEENTLYWQYYLASNGGGILNDSANKQKIMEDKSIEAINLYKNMLNLDNSMPTKSQIGSMTTAQMFITGKIAMYLGGRWLIPKFRETINFDWDIMSFPFNGKDKLYIDSSGWAVTKNSKNKENAIKFVKFMASDDSSKKFAKTGLIIPAKKNIANNLIHDIDKNFKPKNSNIFVKMLEYSKPTPISKNYNTLNDYINEKIKSVYNDNQDIKEVFNKKEIEKIERIIK